MTGMASLPTRTSHGALTLPVIGFGTYGLNGAAGVESIATAIDHGYTLLDSAFNYENEGAVGRAVRISGHRRGDLVVTSKLPGRRQAYDDALVTIQESLYRTGLDVIDLYLIHWPNPARGRYVEAWRALIEARERGLVRAIGVCNFLPDHLETLQRETGVLPEVNQVELHPYFPQQDVVDYDAERGILTQAWSPLGRGSDLLREPVITRIAQDRGVSPGQVVLAWGMARGVIPIPKATSEQRQLENLAAITLELTGEEVSALSGLSRPDGRIKDQDPAVYEEF